MRGLTRHLSLCNSWSPSAYRPLTLGDHRVGLIRPDVAGDLPSLRSTTDGWAIAADAGDPAAVDAAAHTLTSELLAAGRIKKHRRELYALTTAWGAPVLGRVDRAAVGALGLVAFGVHLNGFVRRADGIHVWIGKRADDKAVAPGQLDNIVAGGQPAGLTLHENLVKEAWEEAAMPEALAAKAHSVSAIGYTMAIAEGLRRHVLFCYDLELPESFVPEPNDDELQWFQLWPLARVLEAVRGTDDFKFNVNLVIIDFALRHGAIAPDSAEYLALQAGLRAYP
jgi:8-oxo-dGTP pyrophosphatase MutT (NUDIX family)